MVKIVCKNAEEADQKACEIFAEQIKHKSDSVLGLATGGTPCGMYAKLVELYKKGELDFSDVSTYNLDEYYPIAKSNDQSYDYFMRDNLFNHINIKEENIHIPNGEAPDADAEAARYEKELMSAEVDIQLLGIGPNGHIAFNEPDEFLYVATHVTELTESTIQANARFFASAADVPRRALTMGIGSIFHAKKIVLMAIGENKAKAVSEMFGGKLDPRNPSTFLQLHPDVVVIVDEKADGN